MTRITLSILLAISFQASAAQPAPSHELTEGVHEWKSTSGTLVLVLGSYQDVQRYRRNFTFYVRPDGTNEWNQVPIARAGKALEIGWDTAHGGDVTLADATVVQRADGIYFITAAKRIENGYDGPGSVTVTWYKLWDANGNDHAGPAYSFHPESSRAITGVTGGVDDILRKEATLPHVERLGKNDPDLERIKPSGTIISATRVAGRSHSNVLVLTEKSSQGANGRVEKIDLSATYYGMANSQWKPEWTINDSVQCPGLDAAASFFPDATTATDLDNDGRAEVTVAYSLFCGGGVDPSTVKVIMRQGETKFAIRGESLIRLPGQKPIGGSNTPDPALTLPKNAMFQKHLEAVWKKVSVEKRDTQKK